MRGIVELNVMLVIENEDRVIEVNAVFSYVFGVFLVIPLKKQTASPRLSSLLPLYTRLAHLQGEL